MQRHRNRFVLVFLSFGLLAGCKQTAPVDDGALTAQVQSRLSSDGALAGEPIQTAVQGGVVTLSGDVSSAAARGLAASDAAQIAGVRTVVNNLSVLPPPAPTQAAVAAPPPVQSAPSAVERPSRKPRHTPQRPSRAEVIEQPGQARASQPTDPGLSAGELAASAGAAIAPPPPVTAPPVPAAPVTREVTLAAGTVLPVRLTQTLDSATAQQGQSFSGTLASDVLADGAVALAQGSAVSGRVEAVQEAAHFKGNSLLSVSLTSISRRGNRIPIATDPFTKEGNGRGKNTAEKVGGGAAVGAILGGIFGGGKGAGIGAAAGGGLGAGANAITRGQQVQLPSETLIRFRLSSAVVVRVRDDGGVEQEHRRPLD